MRASDVDAVVSLAASAFPNHFEQRACFEERLALFPPGCFALASHDTVKGYLIAYPWPAATIPPLGSLIGGLLQMADSLYLHDLALHADMAGRGLARPIITRLASDARVLGFRSIALVSVNKTVPFWQKMGFVAAEDDAATSRQLQSYGEDARYMVREV